MTLVLSIQHRLTDTL